MKTLFYSVLKSILFISIYLIFYSSSQLNAQSFSQNNIDLNGKGTINNGTSLTFGPDGRLYVAEYVGVIKALTLERTDGGSYVVTEMEQINGIQSIQGHNDDGSLHQSTMRQTIGLEVVGTAANPVLYVSTSDFRIGGGGGGGSGDVGLDTNSGIITRFSWNGTGWDVVDIIRGLPRSEENHSTNNMEFTTINGDDYLIVASGGHTNAGGPSTNFAYTTEYALSAAILSVNLTMLENMPIQNDNGRKYIYDLPTLDDPSRPNVNGITDPDAPGYDGIDVNDPFGGNDGLNQAIIVPGGPVQIFSPGYRNAYDLVVTESGAVYVTDNGANGGWGGFPVNEGGGDANNDYDLGEPGSSYTSGGEKINNKDHLSLVTLDIKSYQFGSFYGGHPTPVRANPYGAGLYTNPAVTGTEGAIFRTLIYHPNKDTDGFTSDPELGLPANWPPVQVANPVEGDYRGPGDPNPDGPEDELVTIWGTNTNAIDEYTASNFNGAMKGDLIAGVNTGVLRRVQLNEDGSLKELTPSFASGIGGDALGVACNGDNDIFPGTIWVVTLNGKLVVFEPQDFGICLQPEDEGYDPLADYDGDGYTNQDEIDNDTDHCNGGSQPNDHNKTAGAPLISDLNDLDDDSDGIPDAQDPFQLGNPLESSSDAFSLPVINELFSSNPDLQGYMGLGLTGLMNNGDPNPNWLNWMDRRDDASEPNPNDILGGAIGAMTMQMTAGTALGTNNNQEKGFQYGVRVDQSKGVFTVTGGLFNFNDPLQLYGHSSTPNGELGIFIGTGFQDNYIKFVLTKSGLTIQQEINDVPLDPLLITVPEQNRPDSGAALFYVIDPVSGNIDFEYTFDNGPRISAGSLVAQGAILEAIQSSAKDLAVGLIGTSNAPGVELEGTWDYLHVTGSAPYIIEELPEITEIIGAVNETIDLNNYFNDDYGTNNLQFSIVNNSNPAIEAFIVENILEIRFPPTPTVSDITIRATDSDNLFVEQTFKVTVNEAPISNILYRINAGGPTIISLDGEVDWEADTSGENSPYLTEAGGNNTSGFSINNYSEEIDLSTTPTSIFNTERSDNVSGPPNVTYSFPVEQGNYEVRLYMGNGYHGTSDPDERIFDVEIEGITHPEIKDIDLSGTFGHRTGTVITKIVEVNDGFLDIALLHGQIENPLINGIEILGSSRRETPIVVSQIPDQFNIVGEELDGSLAVEASGGDGNLSYSISGAPLGIFIEPTNGQIGGAIDINANDQSPYTITITIDDGDDHSNDAVSISFIWTITAGEPYIVQDIPDLNRYVDSEDETINLNNFFDDNAGRENLLYSIEDNSNTAVNTAILDSLLSISFPAVAAIANITVRATDADNYYVEQTFRVTVNPQTSDPTPSIVLYRVNSGGPAITSIDNEIDWGADTSSENSSYLIEAAGNSTASFNMSNYTDEVNLETTPTGIFNSERSDHSPGIPNITYSFPVAPGNYEVRLYMGNGYHGTSKTGQRIFNVEVEGILYPELEGIDISDTFGHKVGGVISKTVEIIDGSLEISFLHGSIENPLISGIEILGSSIMGNPISITEIADQTNVIGDVLDGTLSVSATGGDDALVYSISGAPAGVVIDASTGVISGSIAPDAARETPYLVSVSVDDSDDVTSDVVSTSFNWTVSSGAPVITTALPDLERLVSSADDSIDLNNYFDDNDGVENLEYSVELNSDPSIGAVIINNVLTLSYPGVPALSELSIRATDTYSNFVEQSFQVNVIEDIGGIDILVESIADQTNVIGDVLDGTLSVSATGGDGALVYTISGAPAGVVIDASTGVISGSIAPDAARETPYVVSVSVDDSDDITTDSVTSSFNWTVSSGAPVIVQNLPGLQKYTGDVDDTFDLNLYFDDNQGVENLVYTVELNSEPSIGASILDNILSLSYPTVTAVSEITIRATDSNSNFVEQSFNVTVIEEPTESGVLYRVNSGGPAIASIDGELDWGGDTSSENSPYLAVSAGNNTGNFSMKNYTTEVDLETTPTSIFNTERSDHYPGAPNITYSFPVDPGTYEVRLYLGNGYHGTSKTDQRIFNVELEGIVHPELNGIDISGTFGHRVGAVISKMVEVTDGSLDISFLHAVENPIVNGIEILGSGDNGNPISITEIADQSNITGDELDGSLAVSATGGDGSLVYSISGAPAGVVIDPVTGVISGTIALDADILSPYNVIITVNDSNQEIVEESSISFTWVVSSPVFSGLWNEKFENQNYTARHECSFVQAGDKFYLMGGRESAKTVEVYDYNTNSWSPIVNSAPFEFNHFQASEYQGLIWVIGAFSTNNFPSEIPTEHVWIFNPDTQEWIQGPSIPENRRRGSTGVVVYNDKFYISGGNTNGHNGGYVPWFDQYDPATGIWTPLADAPTPRDHFHSTVIGDKLYLAGGRLSGGTGGTFKPLIPQVDVYDFSTSTWSTLPDHLPTPRAAAAAVNFEDKLVVIGGEVSNEEVDGSVISDALNITEEYDPTLGEWKRIASLNHKRHGTQAIVSGSGIYITAGSPSLGGGNQKKMEFLGNDTPVGTSLIASSISIPDSLKIDKNFTMEMPLEITGGNTGIFITSIELEGLYAQNFQIIAGNLTNALLKPNDLHLIELEYIGNSNEENANLIINYGLTGQRTIALSLAENNIIVNSISDQTNVIGDVLDGTLSVSATGGDGALVYSISGAPAGVVIDASTGVISGSIAPDAARETPYVVSVSVDDSDDITTDSVTSSFNWTVSSGAPVIVQNLPDLQKYTGDVDDTFDLNLYFDDNQGVENLVYTVELNSEPSIGASILDNILSLSYPTVTAVSEITIRATDSNSNFVEQSFNVTVIEEPTESGVLYRVNSGGPAIASIDGELDWGGDTSSENSPYLAVSAGNNTGNFSMKNYTTEVDLETTPTSIFNTERSDHYPGAPNITYSFPVDPGTYEVRLYLGNGYHGTSKTGQRIFNVELEGIVHPELNGIDISGTFGHRVGAVISKIVEVADGSLDISFLHAVENPLVNGIEILGSSMAKQVVVSGNLNEIISKENYTSIENAHELLNSDEQLSAYLYPNPSINDVYLKLSDPSYNLKELLVYSSNGRLLKILDAKRIQVDKGSYNIDVTGFPDGTYIMKLNFMDTKSLNLRLVKRK